LYFIVFCFIFILFLINYKKWEKVGKKKKGKEKKRKIFIVNSHSSPITDMPTPSPSIIYIHII